MTKRVDLIMNGKGGVGKSFFATNFVQFLKDRRIPFTAFDTDNENSTLKRFHPESGFIDLRRGAEIDRIFSELDNRDLVVVDCRAASTEIFLDYFAEMQVFDLMNSADADLTVISPVGSESDSVEQIRMVAERFNDRCGYVIVRNQFFGESFVVFDHSKTRARLLNELRAREIIMPKLYDWLVAKLNQEDLPISRVLQHPAFSIMDRQRLKNWQRLLYDQLDSVQELLPSVRRDPDIQ